MDSEQRPWGAWFVLEEGPGYKVKRIEVRPGQRLSYQTHDRRAEHWVIVQGTATCTLDGETFEVQDGRLLRRPHRYAAPHRQSPRR